MMNQVLKRLTVVLAILGVGGLLVRCSSTNDASSSVAKFSISHLTQEEYDLKDAKSKVNSLFESNSDKRISDSTDSNEIDRAKEAVDDLEDSSDKDDLLAKINSAKKLLTKKSISESIASSESSASASKDKDKSSSHKSDTAKTSVRSRYKKVALTDFATDPYKYEGKDIETSGHVTYIQKKLDDPNVYYVAILPKDDYSSSGYSYGSVTEVNVDTMQESPIHEGDNITVRGGALTEEVKVNGKKLRADIVVDSVTVH